MNQEPQPAQHNESQPAQNRLVTHLLLLAGAWAVIQVFLLKFTDGNPPMVNVDWWIMIGRLMSEKGFFHVWTPYPPVFPAAFYLLYNVVGEGFMHLAWQIANGLLLLGQAALVYFITRKISADGRAPLLAAAAFLLVMVQPFSLILLGLQMDQFDYLPTLLMLASLFLLLKERPVGSAVLCGIGIMTKLFPAMLIPVAFASLGIRRGLKYAAVAAAVCAAVAVPFLIADNQAFVSTWKWSAARPAWESAWAYAFPGRKTTAVIPNLPETPQRQKDIKALFGNPYDDPAPVNNGELQVDSGKVNAVTGVLMLIGIGITVALLARKARHNALQPEDTVRSLLLMLLLMLAFSKGFSSYFVVWVAPLLCIAYPGVRGFALCGLLIVLGNMALLGIKGTQNALAIERALVMGEQQAAQYFSQKVAFFSQLGKPYLLFWRSILFREFTLLAIAVYQAVTLWKNKEVLND